jgi:hypothetical protein
LTIDIVWGAAEVPMVLLLLLLELLVLVLVLGESEEEDEEDVVFKNAASLFFGG